MKIDWVQLIFMCIVVVLLFENEWAASMAFSMFWMSFLKKRYVYILVNFVNSIYVCLELQVNWCD